MGNLTEIMKSAAEQGIWLFGQPSTFRFDWGNSSGEEKGVVVVVAPALWKVADERGNLLRKVQVLLEKSVARI